MAKKIVLGFSGGLDTSYCVKYLTEEKGYEVHSILVNTGGFTSEELVEIETRARTLGVSTHHTENAVQEYYSKVIRYLIFGNVLKNQTYPLSVSAERIIQATSIATYARSVGADAIAHGSTGAGNDQVRFDLIFRALLPDTEIITPIRDQQLSREAEIEYLRSKGVDMNFEKAKYSINKGLWGTSIGGKETLSSNGFLPEDAFTVPVSKSGPERLRLTFEKGELREVNEQAYTSPVEAIQAVQEIAAPYGIGRDIHVGDTIIGIKGRVGFEAAAPVIIIKAHHHLEKHVLTKWQLSWKDQIAQFYGNWLHEGQLLDPVMRDMEAYMESAQQRVSGDVFLTLFPYRFRIDGVESPYDLMENSFGTYGEMNNQWTGEDVRGFTRIFGNQTSLYYQLQNRDDETN